MVDILAQAIELVAGERDSGGDALGLKLREGVTHGAQAESSGNGHCGAEGQSEDDEEFRGKLDCHGAKS